MHPPSPPTPTVAYWRGSPDTSAPGATIVTAWSTFCTSTGRPPAQSTGYGHATATASPTHPEGRGQPSQWRIASCPRLPGGAACAAAVHARHGTRSKRRSRTRTHPPDHTHKPSDTPQTSSPPRGRYHLPKKTTPNWTYPKYTPEAHVTQFGQVGSSRTMQVQTSNFGQHPTNDSCGADEEGRQGLWRSQHTERIAQHSRLHATRCESGAQPVGRDAATRHQPTGLQSTADFAAAKCGRPASARHKGMAHGLAACSIQGPRGKPMTRAACRRLVVASECRRVSSG